MADRRFLTDVPAESATRSQSSVNALALSIALHAALFAGLTVTIFHTAVVERAQEPPTIAARLVYTRETGGGSSRDGGEKSPAPRQMAQVVGTKPLVAPAARPAPQPEITPREIVPESLPTISTASSFADVGVREAIGTLTEFRPDGSKGAGDGAKVGDGDPGVGCCGGPGNTPGIGDGLEAGVGGVSWPRLLREVKPNYTADAMRAQIEGLVELEIVVLPDGTVGNVRIKRSLDARFGLDTEAIKAVRLWRFDPSRRGGKAIAARVGVELSFTLR
jgi:TonB family protein